MAVPECGAVVLDVGSRDPDSPYARRKTTKLDPSCTYVYGPDGAARVKKLQARWR